VPRPERVVWKAYNWLIQWPSQLCDVYNWLTRPPFRLSRFREAGSMLIGWLSGLGQRGENEPDQPKPDQPKDEVRDYWRAHYEPPDGRAVEYANRYRSTYIWVFVLATLALLFGAVALGLEGVAKGWIVPVAGVAELLTLVLIVSLVGISIWRDWSTYIWVFVLTVLALLFGMLALGLEGVLKEGLQFAAPIIEFLALALILSLVIISIWRDWHERSIEYRLLAELCRKEETLAPLGWALSIAAVQRRVSTQRAGYEAGTSGSVRSTEPQSSAPARDRAAPADRRVGPADDDGGRPADHQVEPADDRSAWVAWLFGALQRAAPFPKGDSASWLRAAWDDQVLPKLVAEQLGYHKRRRTRARRAGAFLEFIGTVVFSAVLVSVLLKLAAMSHGWDHGWVLLFGLLAVVLPGLSAASIGLRAYAELQLLAEQSRHMEFELKRAETHVGRLVASRKMVSQDLGAEAAAVAILMLQDLEGWARLFRVKGMELG
jgi:hypothetical protein